MNVDLSTALQIIGVGASFFAAYTALSTKAAMLELKLWVMENFVAKKDAPLKD